MQEGELTSLRAKLVNTKMLAKIGQEMGLYDYLYLSRGEARDTNPRKCDYLRACVFESIVGALFLDQGFEAAEKFLRFWLLTRLKEAIATGNDAKSVLQEAAQQHEKVTPVYELLSKKGPDHNRSFLIGVFFGNTLIAHGEGPSKQHAEQAAAEKALKLKGWSAPSSTAAQAAE